MKALGLLVAIAACCAAEDPGEIIRRAVARDAQNYALARQYTFLERNEFWEWDGDGQIRNRRSRTYDVTLLEGSPYRRLVARNDRPLDKGEEGLEADKLRAGIEARRKESPAERDRRLADWEKKRRKLREFAAEIPEAFVFRLVGEERLSGRDFWVIQADPRPGYRARTSMARIFPHVRGKLWIDKQSFGWLRADVEVTDTISVGFVLARIAKGTRASMQQRLVNGEVWMPQHLDFEANARLAIFKKLHVGGDITFRDYRKFQVDSRVVADP